MKVELTEQEIVGIGIDRWDAKHKSWGWSWAGLLVPLVIGTFLPVSWPTGLKLAAILPATLPAFYFIYRWLKLGKAAGIEFLAEEKRKNIA